uniref:Mitochondrial substrate carrier family protein ucpB n=1 Tax=Solanum tuberosum TaxID=4113 RepID=M1BEI9_SOLTU
MAGDSTPATGKTLPSGSMEVKERRKWGVSASDVVSHFGTSGMSVAAATAVTHPLDVLKVRLQMQLVGQRGPLVGMGKLSLQVVESEGLRSLYLGLAPSLMRSVLYGGLRLGLYEPSKYLCELAFESTNILVKIASGAFSGAVATALTNPVEVLKVRMQMNTRSSLGPIHEMRRIASEEGVRALWKGVGPAMARAATLTASHLRSVLYGGLRLGLYEPSKYLCELAFESTNILVKIASGAFSGAVATALTNPVEVLKVRMQMNTRSSLGPIHEMRRIASEEGVRALWKGVGPAMARAATLTASQLATYDESKQALIKYTPLEEGFHLHLISSTIAGSVSTVMTAPMDMVKTRLMLQRESNCAGLYRNGLHCAYQVVTLQPLTPLFPMVIYPQLCSASYSIVFYFNKAYFLT